MRNVLYFVILTLVIVSCESPLEIQQHELDNIEGAHFNRTELKNGGDFSVGYENGNIQTSKVELNWSQTTEEDFIFYKLTRNNNELAVFNNIATTTFIDSLVGEDNYYDYQITVFAENGMVAKDTIEIKTPKWQTPSNLRVNGLSETDVKLMWDDNSDSEDNFKIYFYDDSTRSLIDSFLVAANVTEKIVTNLDSLETYSFSVKALNSWEEDTNTSPDELFDMENFVFYSPSNLNCNQNTDMSIEMNWIDNSSLETGFAIERKINNSEFIEITEITEINLETYTDIDTTAYSIGDLLTYRVRALNDYVYPTEYTDYSDEYELVVVEIGNGLVTITVQVDSYPSEASWNVYNSDTNLSYFDNYQTFDNGQQSVTETISLESGDYYIHCLDTYGDGGISGEVFENGSMLINWDNNDYSSEGIFQFQVGN